MIVWMGGKGKYMDIIYTHIYIYIYIYCRGGCICMFDVYG